jgi:cellulose synthase/poly-beta-1,6-N-acetylglucosamine synthase-like glycosyltransferase
MPRLRKVQLEKYGDLNHDIDEYPIDSIDQQQIINNLKKKAKLSESKTGKLTFKGYLILLLIINSCLILIPYYRRGLNAIFSSIASIMLFLPIVLAYSTVHSSNNDFLPILKNIKFISTMLAIYICSIILKIIYFKPFENSDLIYILPILLAFCVIDINVDDSKINKAIEELEKLRYDYKEA